MLALVSPAKKLDFEAPSLTAHHTQPDLLDETKILVDNLKGKSRNEIKSLMKLSDKLAELNYNRYQNFETPFTQTNAKQAAYVFRGDTYVGLDADSLSEDDMLYAQDHLRILSGLYGLLRPLDLMQPYRLEMGTSLTNERGEDLYDFWGTILAEICNEIVEKHESKAIISLASNEYIKALSKKSLKAPLITCHFKEMKDGKAKVIGLFAKRARGMMARHIIQNRIDQPEGLKTFNTDGYKFQPDQSTDTDLVFIR